MPYGKECSLSGMPYGAEYFFKCNVLFSRMSYRAECPRVRIRQNVAGGWIFVSNAERFFFTVQNILIKKINVCYFKKKTS